MIYGYARVSTNDQDLTGQVEALTAAGCQRIFQEKVSGAKKDNRPELSALLAEISKGDSIIVTRLDRLARSTHDLWTILKLLDARGATIRSISDTWLDTTSAHGRLIVTIMAGIAEFERELIKARTSEGRARAKAQGKRIGGPEPKLSEQQRENVKLMLAAKNTVESVAELFSVSKRTIQRIRNAA